jgi:hypothetical protein
MATYYIKTAGNDYANGNSDGTAWATISKVNSVSYSPGDQILFNRGDVWQETLVVSSSGTSGYPIIFGAYGTGVLPIITARGTLPGWNTSGNWTDEGGNKWSFGGNYTGNFRLRLWLSGVIANRARYTGDLDAGHNYYYTTDPRHLSDDPYDATPLYELWVYSTDNPAYAEESMEYSGALARVLSISAKDYITFENIDFQGGGGGNSWECGNIENSDNIIFSGCSIGMDAGCYGLKFSYCNNGEISYCTFDTGDVFFDYYNSQSQEDALSLYTVQKTGCHFI